MVYLFDLILILFVYSMPANGSEMFRIQRPNKFVRFVSLDPGHSNLFDSCRLSLFCNTLLPTICKAFHAQNTEGFGFRATFKASFECGQIDLGPHSTATSI